MSIKGFKSWWFNEQEKEKQKKEKDFSSSSLVAPCVGDSPLEAEAKILQISLADRVRVFVVISWGITKGDFNDNLKACQDPVVYNSVNKPVDKSTIYLN